MSSQDDVQRKRIASFLQALCAAKYAREDNVPCQIEEGLFLGSVGVACNKEALKSVKITHVLIVANSLEPAFPDDFIYKKIEGFQRQVRNSGNCLLRDLTYFLFILYVSAKWHRQLESFFD